MCENISVWIQIRVQNRNSIIKNVSSNLQVNQSFLSITKLRNNKKIVINSTPEGDSPGTSLRETPHPLDVNRIDL